MTVDLRLSPRLRAVVEAIPPGSAVADVGTDHGLVPAALGLQRRCPKIIASDCRSGPLRAAARTFARCGLVEIDVRRGDGLQVLAPGEVETVVLSGMGAHRMFALLDAAPAQTAALRHLVLAPNTAWPWTRRALAARGWALSGETLVAEGESFYVVFVLDLRPNTLPPALSEADLTFGPHLRRSPTPTFVAWLEQMASDLDAVLAKLPVHVGSEHPRRQELLRRRASVDAELEAARAQLRLQ